MPSGIMWNARSHAAYHGYSHLSGIEMMSLLNMWAHSLLRTCLRSCCGRSAPAPCSSSQVSRS